MIESCILALVLKIRVRLMFMLDSIQFSVPCRTNFPILFYLTVFHRLMLLILSVQFNFITKIYVYFICHQEVLVGPENRTAISNDNFLRVNLIGDFVGYTNIPSFEDFYLVIPRQVCLLH